jgi:hypothetical protein
MACRVGAWLHGVASSVGAWLHGVASSGICMHFEETRVARQQAPTHEERHTASTHKYCLRNRGWER